MKWVSRIILLMLVRIPAVRADVPPPTGTKLVPVTGVVEVTEALDDFRFFLSDRRTYFGPPRSGVIDKDETKRWRSDQVITEVILRSGDQVRASGGRREDTALYAIPRAAFVPTRSVEELIADVDQGKVPGALREYIGSGGTLSDADPRSEVIRQYQLRRAASGGGLDLVRVGEDPQIVGPGNPVAATTEFRDRWVVPAGLTAAAIVGFGLWWMRRSTKSRSSAV